MTYSEFTGMIPQLVHQVCVCVCVVVGGGGGYFLYYFFAVNLSFVEFFTIYVSYHSLNLLMGTTYLGLNIIILSTV